MGFKYAVIGTGAIGGYYGGKLAKAGNEVHFLFRSDFEHVKKNGLQINSVDGNFLINPVLAYNSTDDMSVCTYNNKSNIQCRILNYQYPNLKIDN